MKIISVEEQYSCTLWLNFEEIWRGENYVLNHICLVAIYKINSVKLISGIFFKHELWNIAGSVEKHSSGEGTNQVDRQNQRTFQPF